MGRIIRRRYEFLRLWSVILTLKYWSASSIISGSLESLGKEGTGPRIEHLMGKRATLPTLSTPAQGADEW